MTNTIILGGDSKGTAVTLDLSFANRHGLIAGATGTGKTISVQVIAEAFSRAGVPVFLTDVKGDLSGIAERGKPHKKIDERLTKMPLANYQQEGNPVRFWDILGKSGMPVRLAISDLGPQLLARLLDLNETQEAILTIVFDYADDEGLLLINLDDLKTSLNFVQENSKSLSSEYGRISSASVSAIRRRLLLVEQEGLEDFFGEPAIEFEDLVKATNNKQGMVNILSAESLMSSPKSYSIFLLWLMSELFENLPEIGNPEKPVLALFFDEAHLLFKDCPKVFLNKIEQVVRLIRSKGVGIYFITQSPNDIPDSVLGQLGNRIQHALRAYTPKDVKAVKTAAQSFRANPDFDTVEAITGLGVGEALVSTLENKGAPSMVARTLMAPPRSKIGPITKTLRKEIIASDTMLDKYKMSVDPESAHEILKKRRDQLSKSAEAAIEKSEKEKKQPVTKKKKTQKKSSRQGIGEAFVKSIARSLGGTLGRKLIRGILGSLLK